MSSRPDIDRINARLPPFMALMRGRLERIDAAAQAVEMSFQIGPELCHSVDIVQGGFITAMLDAAMSHAVFALDDTVLGLSSLEISTRYLEVTRAGPCRALGRIVRVSYKTAFLEGELLNTHGLRLATAQTVAKLSRKSSAA